MEDTFLRKGVFYFARQKVGQIGINTYENVLTNHPKGSIYTLFYREDGKNDIM